MAFLTAPLLGTGANAPASVTVPLVDATLLQQGALDTRRWLVPLVAASPDVGGGTRAFGFVA